MLVAAGGHGIRRGGSQREAVQQRAELGPSERFEQLVRPTSGPSGPLARGLRRAPARSLGPSGVCGELNSLPKDSRFIFVLVLGPTFYAL